MKIVTYNVNGLRPRISQHGSLRNLLSCLDADIICFQETKLSRKELSADLVMAEGYEAFFSCTRTSSKGRPIGYSGVVTFCRVKSAFSSDEVALPISAEEGFTGLLDLSKAIDPKISACLLETPSYVEELITEKDLLKVDSEGRCIITDHGHFVLFNLYGPRADSDNPERLRFKMIFFTALQMGSSAESGRRVLVVGDFNIAPSVMDHCDAGPYFEDDRFRRWLRSLLKNGGGPFVDGFREMHPKQKDAYTCWAQNTGAEEFNFGSRIDLILIGGPCLHQDADLRGHELFNCHVTECDIMAQFKRCKPDNDVERGRSLKLDGSDHVPVYVNICGMPLVPPHNTPPLAARYVPEIRGLQQTIASWLQKRPIAAAAEDQTIAHGISKGKATIENFVDNMGPDGCLIRKEQVYNYHSCNTVRQIAEQRNLLISASEKNAKGHQHCKGGNGKEKIEYGGYSQLKLQSFFQRKVITSSVNVCDAATDISSSQEDLSVKEQNSCLEDDMDEILLSKSEESGCQSNCINTIASSNPTKKDNRSALVEWQKIQTLMKDSVPLCVGHGEPCVARYVKKSGPNIGRGFYVCARAKGPASNPDARCDYFQWATSKSKRKRR